MVEALAERQGAPFDVAEVDPAVIPVVAQNTLQQCVDTNLALTQVVIERNTTYDPEGPDLEVFASNDRQEGGYIVYALDGTLLVNYCD